MGCEFRFKAAVQARERVARFRVFLADHINGQLVILNKSDMRIVALNYLKTRACIVNQR